MTIHDFAVKWYTAFSGAMRQPPALDEFPDDCFDAGLISDAGQSFRALYGEAALTDAGALGAILDAIDDPGALGNALFSAWQGWQSYDDLRPVLEWYLLALERLSVIS